jgi:hypothetical protein
VALCTFFCAQRHIHTVARDTHEASPRTASAN